MRATRAIIHTDNIKHNINVIKSLVGKAEICAVVKANGYGSSGEIVATTAQSLGIKTFAVATVSEGAQLRNASIKGRILLLSPFDKTEVTDIVKNNLTPCVTDATNLLIKDNQNSKNDTLINEIFLAIETGMGRIGCVPRDIELTVKSITKLGVKVAGLITHFSVGDSSNIDDESYTANQLKLFTNAIDKVVAAGIKRESLCCTASASSAFLMSETWETKIKDTNCNTDVRLDMVRAGIILYGLPPSSDVARVMTQKNIDLRPVMSVVTKVALIKHYKAGDCISYGRTFICKSDTTLAVLPIGYADGLLRRYGSFLRVAINGGSYPIAGRICMDMCMVDLGANVNNIKAGDDVIIFGDKNKGAIMDATDIAKSCGTINYEVTSCISSRVPRVAQ